MNAVAKTVQEGLNEQLAKVRTTINRLREKLAAVDAELQEISGERERYELLDQICVALEKLDEKGAGHLFWGKKASAEDKAAHLRNVRAGAAGFMEKLAEIQQRRQKLENEIEQYIQKFDLLSDELIEQQEAEENAKYEFVVNRDYVPPPYRPAVMPWSEEGEDRQRFRKTILLALLFSLLFAVGVAIWKLPLREKTDVTEIPERLVKLVQRDLPKPPEPKPLEQQKREDTKDPQAKPSPSETQQARAKAEQSGVLKFKNAFAELMDEKMSDKLGAEAQISQGGHKSVGDTKRSLVVAHAKAGSGGINNAGISRDVGGTGKKVGGVQFTRVESSVSGMKAAGRALSDGPGPSRTDEEIQIVFDRYKASLYRIYNRELRNDPTLRGKMVLRITIEPNGEVSACRIESSDLASAVLKTEVVERVKRFNFGPKENVPRITILYPIDFLPAT